MFTYTLENKKPTVWRVEFDGRTGHVLKSEDDGVRSKRWQLKEGEETKFFKSRRAAFYFFRTGEKFETKPVFARGAKGSQKRIR